MASAFKIRPYSDADAAVALYGRAAIVDPRLGPIPIACCPAYPAQLNVSNKNAAALTLYGSLGFLPRHETCRYHALRSQVLASLARRKV